jgi:signal peptidase
MTPTEQKDRAMSATAGTLPARITRGLSTLLLVAITAVSAAYLLPSLFGYERYVITGGSMSGAFEKGAIAFEKPVPVDDLVEGDVVTYLPPADSGVSTLVTHRIVSARTNDQGARVFTTQGDANADADPWKFELESGVQPRVEFTVPLIGYAFIAVADRETRMLVIGLPAALIALSSLIELLGNLRQDRRPVAGSTRTGRRAVAPALS